MGKKLPVLIIIPHGGYKIPEELAEYTAIDKFDIFLNSDSCSNELFSIDNSVSAKIDTDTSRLFVDVDRPNTVVPPQYSDGVIKKETPDGKLIYNENEFPDEIAIANIMKRYYAPFHQAIEKILRTGEIKLIIECHTMPAVGSKKAPDPGKPRPIFTVGNLYRDNNVIKKTCNDNIANAFLNNMKRSFSSERITVAERFSLNKPPFYGYILKKYGDGKIPMLFFSLTRALFFNDEYFNYDYLKVDELRINHLKEKILNGIERFYSKFSKG